MNLGAMLPPKFRLSSGAMLQKQLFFAGFRSSGCMSVLGPKFMNLGVNLGKLRGELRWQRCQDLGSHVDFGLS